MNTKWVPQRSKQGNRPSDRGSRFNSRFKTNTLMHSYEKVFRCEICGELYRFKARLMRHLLSHEGFEKVKYRNSRKLLTFENCIKSQDRMVVVHSGGGGMLKCDVCGKLYKYEGRLRQHMLLNHVDGMSLKRHDFSKISTLDSSPKAHDSPCSEDGSWNSTAMTDTVAGTGEKPLDCKVCGKSYKYEKRLREHLLMHISDRNFKSESSIKRSIQEPSTKTHTQLISQDDSFKNPSLTSSLPYTGTETSRNGEVHTKTYKYKKRLIKDGNKNTQRLGTAQFKTFGELCKQEGSPKTHGELCKQESSPKTHGELCKQESSPLKTHDKQFLQEDGCNDHSVVPQDDSFGDHPLTSSTQDGSSETNDRLLNRDHRRCSNNSTKTDSILRIDEETMNCAVCGKSYKYRKRLVKHLIKHNLDRKLKSKTLHNICQDNSFSNHSLTSSTDESYAETNAKMLMEDEVCKNHATSQDCSLDNPSATSVTQESSRETKTKLSSQDDSCNNRTITNAVPGTSEDTMACQVCGKVYKYKERLRKHLIKHELGRRPESGETCEPESSPKTRDKQVVLDDSCNDHNKCQDDSFNGHTSSIPNGVVLLTQNGTCNDLATSQKDRLNSHALTNGTPHTGKETVNCEVCGKTFKYRKNLFRHVIKHNRGQRLKRESLGEDGRLKRESLGEDFGRLKRKSLAELSTQETPRTTTNELLPAQDSSSGSDIKPNIFVNTGEKPLQCGICGKSYMYKESLRKHLLLHGGHVNIKSRDSFKLSSPVDSSVNSHCEWLHQVSGTKTSRVADAIEERPKCNICGKFYKNKTTLKRHMLLHMVSRNFQSACSGKVVSQGSFQRSPWVTSSSGKRSECSECGKMVRRCYLKTHMKLHKEKKNFRCKDCGQSFRQRSHLLTHSLTHAGDDKSFECNDCGKRFWEKLELRRHILEHTSENSFTCGVCGHLYIQTCHLDSHVLTTCA